MSIFVRRTLLLLYEFTSYKSIIKREGRIRIESGFDMIRPDKPISLPFFNFALLFLVFDIEIILFIPILFRNHYYLNNPIKINLSIFILLTGIYFVE